MVRGLSSEPIEFCTDDYCYRSDGELKAINSLEEAQKQCEGRSWLLEIYVTERERVVAMLPDDKPVLLNTMGTGGSDWISAYGKVLTGMNEILV